MRSQNEVIGILEAINPVDGYFDLDALEVLTGIGSLAGTAINHARLYEQVQTTQQRYLELFQDSIDPIIITDLRGKIIEANRQAELFTMFTKSDLFEFNISQLLSKDGETLQFDPSSIKPGVIETFEAKNSPPSIQNRSLLWCTFDPSPLRVVQITNG